MKFKVREKQIRRKRNKFFASSIRNLGKTKDELRKEQSEIFMKKRTIQLGAGLKLPEVMSVVAKRTLLRSGSSLGLRSITK